MSKRGPKRPKRPKIYPTWNLSIDELRLLCDFRALSEPQRQGVLDGLRKVVTGAAWR
jgi:hypothetical protein